MSDYYLLIAVILILIFGAVKGYRKGFLRLAVWFAGLIAVLFIVTKLSPYVSSFLIENTSVYDNLRVKIVTAYKDANTNTVTDESSPGDESENNAIDAFGLSEKTRKYGGDHSGYDTMMLYEIQDVLESLPSADRPTGEWVRKVKIMR